MVWNEGRRDHERRKGREEDILRGGEVSRKGKVLRSWRVKTKATQKEERGMTVGEPD